MDNFKLLIVENRNDLVRCYPVMRELRKELSYDDYISLYEKAHASDGYEIVALTKNKEILAVMGYRVLYDFVHGKHLYVDDLVSSEPYRSKGLGTKLLQYAEELAMLSQCKGLRICTGIENERGKTFYERNEWKLRAVAYKKKLANT